MFDRLVEKLKPWVTIWYQPRETVRGFLDGVANPSVNLIFILYTGVLAVRTYRGNGPIDYYIEWGEYENIFKMMFAVFSTFVRVYIEIWFLAFIYNSAARLFGGHASNEQTRIAVLWYKVPYIMLSIVAEAGALFFLGGWPESKFVIQPNWASLSAMPPLQWVVMILFVVVFLWRVYILSSGLAEVNDFPQWKGFAAWAVSWLVMGLFFGAMYLVS